jgi:spore germination protein YaaH
MNLNCRRRNTARAWMLFADLLLLGVIGTYASGNQAWERFGKLLREYTELLHRTGDVQSRLNSLDQEKDQHRDEYERLLEGLRRDNAALNAELKHTKDLLASANEENAAGKKREEDLKRQVAKAESEKEALKNQLAARSSELDKKIAELTEEIKRLTSAAAQRDVVQAQLVILKKENTSLQGQLAELKRKIEELIIAQAGVHRALLGLKSKKKGDDLGTVVLLVDTSGSMDYDDDRKNQGGPTSRWSVTRETIKVWAEHLAAEKIILIRFHSRVEDPREFRTDRKAREELAREIDGWKPDGETATYDALEKAYSFPDVDAIILITDGEPNRRAGAYHEFQEATEEIYELIKARDHDKIPINVVAVGQYFDQKFSGFMRQLAKLTKGSFQGR